MKHIISIKLALIMLFTSLSSWAPMVEAATKKSNCESGECIPKLIDRLEDVGALFSAQCLPKNIKHEDIEKYHVKNGLSEQCWKYITEINHLESELLAHQNKLESRLGCENGECKAPDDSLNSQLGQLSKVENNLSCNETKKAEIRNQCPSDLTCVMVSSAMGMGGYLAEVIVPAKSKPKGCHLGNDSCLTQLAIGFLRAAITFFDGAWDLLKIVGKKAGKKMKQFWNWVSGAENHSSSSQLAMAKASKDPGIFDQLVSDFPGTMKKIWSAFVGSMKEWMKTQVFCQKWAGVPQFSKCLQPTDSFDCLPCKTLVTGLCSVSGTLVAEVVPSFLTGGLITAVKHGAGGAVKIAKLFRVSKKAMAAIKASRVGKIAIQASTKADEVLKITRGLVVAKTAVNSALTAIKTYLLSPARKALKVSYTALINAAKKGSVSIAATPVGKVLIFTGTALKKTGTVILYPIDNPLTTFAYKSGVRTFDKALSFGRPTLAAQSAVSLSLTQRRPQLETILAKIDEARMAAKPNGDAILKLELQLLNSVEPIRLDAVKSVLGKTDVEFSEVIKKLYPELKYDDLARSVAPEKILKVERELYLEISKLPDSPHKKALMTRYQSHVAQGELRAKIVGEAKTPFDVDAIPAEKIAANENFNIPLTPEIAVKKQAIREYMHAGFEEILEKGRQVESKILKAKEPVVYDAIAVGAGPNTGVAVAAIKEANPNLNVLVIESTENLGTFHRVKAFDINSAEWIGNSGNNFPTSPVQLRDFNINNASFPTAEELGHVTQATFDVAQPDMIFNNAVTKWSKEPTPGAWPAKYKVETSKGHVIYTRSGIITPGLGTPVNRLRDAPSIKLVSTYEEQAKAISLAKDAKYVPRFQDVETYIANAAKDQKRGRQAVGRYKGKKTLVVGDGDGGSIGVEAATGLNKQLNPKGIKTDVEVVWMGQPAKTGTEFSSKMSQGKNFRYGRIGEAIDDGRVKTVNGYLQRVEEFVNKSGETQFKAFYTAKTGEAIADPVIVDNVVFATGYTHSHKTVTPFFQSMTKNSDDISFVPLKGSINDYTRFEKMKTATPHEINKQLMVNGSKEDVYLLGIGSKTPISKRKFKAVTGGFLDLTGPRAAATGKHVAQSLAPQKFSKGKMISLLTPAKGKQLQFIKRPLRSAKQTPLNNVELAAIHSKLEFGKTLKNFKSAPNSEFSLTITRDLKGDYIYKVTGLDKASSEKLVQAMSQNHRLTNGLDKQMHFKQNKIVVTATTRESGAIRLENLELRTESLALKEPIPDPAMNISGGLTKFMSPTLKTAGDSKEDRENAQKQE